MSISLQPPTAARSDQRVVRLSRAGLRRLMGLLLAVGLAAGSLAQESAGETDPPDGWWLVTVDGQRIASREKWELRGRRILYTNAAGDLVSVRASEIDLDASQRVTFPPPPSEEQTSASAPREAVLVLTQKDVAQHEPGDASPADAIAPDDGESPSPAEPAAEPAAPSNPRRGANEPAVVPIRKPAPNSPADLSVVSWRDMADDYGSSANLLGTVRNDGEKVVKGASLQIVAFDQEGNELGRQRAQMLSSELEPGETTTFRAVFSQLGPYGEIQFEFQTN